MRESTQLQIDVTLYASDMTHNCLLIHHVDDVQGGVSSSLKLKLNL